MPLPLRTEGIILDKVPDSLLHNPIYISVVITLIATIFIVALLPSQSKDSYRKIIDRELAMHSSVVLSVAVGAISLFAVAIHDQHTHATTVDTNMSEVERHYQTKILSDKETVFLPMKNKNRTETNVSIQIGEDYVQGVAVLTQDHFILYVNENQQLTEFNISNY